MLRDGFSAQKEGKNHVLVKHAGLEIFSLCGLAKRTLVFLIVILTRASLSVPCGTSLVSCPSSQIGKLIKLSSKVCCALCRGGSNPQR